MQIVTAPEAFQKKNSQIGVFLAGGITNCSEWQSEVIECLINLSKYVEDNLENLIIFNPRRKNFPIDDPNAANEQITWEFSFLEKCDIFSMYFDYTEKSDQPICFYELGRNLIKMEIKFPEDFKKRIIISYKENFKRAKDVEIQTNLALNIEEDYMIKQPVEHAIKIIEAYRYLLKKNENSH